MSLTRIPLVIVATATGQQTPNVLVGVMATELDDAEAANACFRELLERVITDDFQLANPGLSEDIAHALGLIESWRCECGDLNRYCDVFCYRCGAGKPEDEPSAS